MEELIVFASGVAQEIVVALKEPGFGVFSGVWQGKRGSWGRLLGREEIVMTGTFEIVFAGLCFLLLGGMADDGGYENLQVNLPQTCHPDQDHETECRPAQTECEDIELFPHAPVLVIPDSQRGIVCSTGDGGTSCRFEDMGCEKYELVNGGSEWWCDLNGRELCVSVDDADASRFQLAEGRDGRENRPDDDDERSAFDWIPHLARIDGYHIARLKEGVYGPVGSDEDNLIASRLHASHGELSTLSLGVPPEEGEAWSWKVRPNRQPGWPWQEDHRKVVAEAMLLRIESVKSVRLENCRADKSEYWWKFEASNEPYRIRVQHFASDQHPWTANTALHPHRIRDFLWYYNLVEWMDGECPDYLSAPVCPDGNCRKEWPEYIPKDTDYLHEHELPGGLRNANHFCQPSTYP